MMLLPVLSKFKWLQTCNNSRHTLLAMLLVPVLLNYVTYSILLKLKTYIISEVVITCLVQIQIVVNL